MNAYSHRSAVDAEPIHASGNICVYASGSLALMEGMFLPRALTV
jgi:hypothetical protein